MSQRAEAAAAPVVVRADPEPADGKPFVGYTNESDVLRDDVDKGLVAPNAIVVELGAEGARKE